MEVMCDGGAYNTPGRSLPASHSLPPPSLEESGSNDKYPQLAVVGEPHFCIVATSFVYTWLNAFFYSYLSGVFCIIIRLLIFI